VSGIGAQPAVTHYDLIAIGSGPAGRAAALQAAQLGRRVAIVDRGPAMKGTSTTGALPAKALQAAILEVTGVAPGLRLNGADTAITFDDLLWRAPQAIEHEQDAIRDQLRRSRVDVQTGTAAFLDSHTLEVRSGAFSQRVSAELFMIAVGATLTRPPSVDFDDRTVLDANGMRHLREIPGSLTVVGAGVIGLEYASMAAALGSKITVVDRSTRILEVADDEVADGLGYHLRGLGADFQLGQEVVGVERPPRGGAVTHLQSGASILSDVVIYAAGRDGATAALNLGAAGLQADHRGRVAVDDDFRTVQPHIFAVGDVIGSQSLAGTSIEHGRLAALAALGKPVRSPKVAFPRGISTIPEIAFAGHAERELAAAGVPYVHGRAAFRQLARGMISAHRAGFLKLLVHSQTRCVMGVHIFGPAATELIHIGQIAMATDLTVDSLANAAFTAPSYADAYRIAALDATSRLSETGVAPISAAS
jgi:NAD(P) transhydrogenase